MKLPKGWCLWREDGLWAAGRIGDDCFECGLSVERLAPGDTPAGAVKAGRRVLRERAAEQKRRDEDFARRKAAGALTEWELAGEQHVSMWNESVRRIYSEPMPGSFAQLVNRRYESDATAVGDTIKIAGAAFSAGREAE